MIKLTLSFLLLISLFCSSQTDQQLQNISAFNRAYGYVKYFHPSDEVSQIDWKQFAVYGVHYVLNSSTSNELCENLEKLFRPIAPSVTFSTDSTFAFDQSQLLAPKNKRTKFTYWQHQGLGFETIMNRAKYSPYKSVKVNRFSNQPKLLGSFTNIMTSFDATAYRGKRIKFSAWVKMDQKDQGVGNLWMRVDNVDGKGHGFFDNTQDSPIKNQEWTRYEIVGTLDEFSQKVAIGCFLTRGGSLHIDNIQVEVETTTGWCPVPIVNNSFEDEGVLKEHTSFKQTGSGICSIVTDDIQEGNKALLLSLISPAFTSHKLKPLFKEKRSLNDVFRKNIGGGIIIHVPMTLLCTKEHTYPIADVPTLNQLKDTLKSMTYEPEELSTRLGNCVIVYNIFQHFYSYFNEVPVAWEDEFLRTIKRSFGDKTRHDHFITLEKFTAPLKDGHIHIVGDQPAFYNVPIRYEWIQNKLVVTDIYSANVPFEKGVVITEINGQSTESYFEEIRSRVSYGTEGWLNYRASHFGIFTSDSSDVIYTINGIEHRVKKELGTNSKYIFRDDSRPSHEQLEQNIYYLNIDKIDRDTIKKLLPILKSNDGIICDLRGYPNSNENLLSYLMSKRNKSKAWISVATITAPDQEKEPKFDFSGWPLRRKKPYLGDKKIIFLMDGRAISYAESYLGYVEAYKLATLVGQPTAGTNGDINSSLLAGEFEIYWTGSKVTKHDGSQLHAIGILPDVYVERTLDGFQTGKDEFLEKAIELIISNEINNGSKKKRR